MQTEAPPRMGPAPSGDGDSEELGLLVPLA